MSGKGAFFSPGRKPLFPFLRKKEEPTGDSVQAEDSSLAPQEAEGKSGKPVGSLPEAWQQAAGFPLASIPPQEASVPSPQAWSMPGNSPVEPPSSRGVFGGLAEEPMIWTPGDGQGPVAWPSPLPRDEISEPPQSLGSSFRENDLKVQATFSPDAPDVSALVPPVFEEQASGWPGVFQDAESEPKEELIRDGAFLHVEEASHGTAWEPPLHLEVVSGGSEPPSLPPTLAEEASFASGLLFKPETPASQPALEAGEDVSEMASDASEEAEAVFDLLAESREPASEPQEEEGFSWDRLLGSAPATTEAVEAAPPTLSLEWQEPTSKPLPAAQDAPAWSAPAWGWPTYAKDEGQQVRQETPVLIEETSFVEPLPMVEIPTAPVVEDASSQEGPETEMDPWSDIPPASAENSWPDEVEVLGVKPVLGESNPFLGRPIDVELHEAPEPFSPPAEGAASFTAFAAPPALWQTPAGETPSEGTPPEVDSIEESKPFDWPDLGDQTPSEEEVLAQVWKREEVSLEPEVQEEGKTEGPDAAGADVLVEEPLPRASRADEEVAAFDLGVLPQPMAAQPPEVPAWKEDEESRPEAAADSAPAWGVPSEWRHAEEGPSPSAPEMIWVDDESEKPAPIPQPVRPAAAFDFDAQFEKSIETLFSQNRDFRWKKVGELLQELGLVSDADLAEALALQVISKKPLGRILVDQGIISDRLLLKVLAAQKDVVPCFLDAPLEPDLLSLLEPEFCLRCQVLPISQKASVLTLAMRNPSDVDTIDFVAQTTGLGIEPALADEELLAKKIEEAYARDARSHRARVNELVQEAIKTSDIRVVSIDESKSVQAIEEETRPVSAIVHKLLSEAVKMRASDIHMEPTLYDLQVRYRIDGRLHKVNSVPRELQPMILARVKILAELDPVEWRIPQDGRISFESEGKAIDLRVSVLPSFYGGRVVMRILDRSIGLKNLEDIGFSESNLAIFRTLIKRPYGLFLVTGPTGSGKTTSLYAALNEVKDDETNIITCEDPVEYNLEGISQSQVNTKIGLTFAAQLRSILRQDPDVVLVGEIRDHETAETAIRASMTGHLVFSTLHCNDAPSAIPRLLDMNIDPYLLSTSLIGVMGQRLLRKICPDCGHEYKPDDAEKAILERTFGLVGVGSLYKGRGCVHCAHTGFRGRFAVHEIMPVTQEISSHIAVRAATEKLAEVSRSYGYRTMQEDAMERVLRGQTSLKEAQRLLAFDDIPKMEPGSKKAR